MWPVAALSVVRRTQTICVIVTIVVTKRRPCPFFAAAIVQMLDAVRMSHELAVVNILSSYSADLLLQLEAIME